MQQSKIPIYWVHFVREYLPLSLGMILAYARTKLSPERFDLSARFVASRDELTEALREHGPGFVMFSDYMWNIDDHLEASALVKQVSPESITVHGGPSFPSHADPCREFLLEHRHIDYGVVGEGEKTAVELLTHLTTRDTPPSSIPGLRFLWDDQVTQTPTRARSTDLDEFPSPYLTGVFDGFEDRATYGLVETNRGCPYGCTFCDWGSATRQKIRPFSMDRVRGEIEWLSRAKIADLYITDSNFGIFERDVEICEMLCEQKRKTGFPERVILSYAKNTKAHLVKIVELMDEAGLIGAGVMSIQSRDPQTLVAIRRKNIRTEEYDKLRSTFNARQLPLDTHLMLGLAGSTLESFKEDLRYYFFQDINVRVFNTVLLVNSPMAEPSYREQYRIETDPSGSVIATSTLTRHELKRSEFIARLFRCAHDYGMLRYLLSYLWWDHGVDPIDLLDRLIEDAQGSMLSGHPLLSEFCGEDELNAKLLADFRHTPKELDTSKRAVSPLMLIQATHLQFRDRLRQEGSWRAFYEEVAAYVEARCGLRRTPGWAVAMEVQAALMPTQGRAYPHRVRLEHDYVAYFTARQAGEAEDRPLCSYPPGTLEVRDAFESAEKGSYRQDWSLTDVWQLASELPGAGRSTLRRYIQDQAPRRSGDRPSLEGASASQ